MTIKLRHENSGIALIIVMVVTTFLAILAGGFAYSMKVETKLARNASFETDFEWMARSGAELAKWVLAQSSTGPGVQYDALNQRWAGGLGNTNDGLEGIDLKNYPVGDAQSGGGTLSVEIVDHDRKFNINVADEVILKQALNLMGVDAGEIPTVVDSILDWRDPDDSPRSSGAETSHYQPLGIYCKNGPLDDITELLYINGITHNMYYGPGAVGRVLTTHQNSQRNPRGSKFEEPTYSVGLMDLFTTTSSRLLNINTASPQTLQIFPEIDENVANAIVTARNGPDGVQGTDDDTPFRSPQELGRVPGINPAAAMQFARYFTVRSLIFEAKIGVNLAGETRQYVALLRRNGAKDIQILHLNRAN
ncbi:MAG TPA: helix-hairpin-helix domain-containing protein [Verrucomicrobiae bacterium]|jgi:general secretion pathway protein K